jgi:hypothetical protein
VHEASFHFFVLVLLSTPLSAMSVKFGKKSSAKKSLNRKLYWRISGIFFGSLQNSHSFPRGGIEYFVFPLNLAKPKDQLATTISACLNFGAVTEISQL